VTYKFIVFIVTTVLLTGGGLVIKVSGNSPEYNWKAVRIEAGDRVWCYAETCQQSGINKDIRKIVWDIEQYNDINAGYIVEGQVIYVPSLPK
jgi:hypothetical protein